MWQDPLGLYAVGAFTPTLFNMTPTYLHASGISFSTINNSSGTTINTITMGGVTHHRNGSSSGGAGSPISVTRTGNDVSIFAYAHIWGSGANLEVPHGRGVTFRQATISGIMEYWSGYRGGLNVNVTVIDLNDGVHLIRYGQGRLSIEIRDEPGRAQHSAYNWSVSDPGMITLFTHAYGGSANNILQFPWIAAHEFGHAMGVGDGFGFGHGGDTTHGNVHSIMTTWPHGATRLDLELVMRAHRSDRWQTWDNNRRFIRAFGIHM